MRRSKWIAFAVWCALASARVGLGDPVQTWGGLREQGERRDGFFARWSVDQRKVLSALRSTKVASRISPVARLRARVHHDPSDTESRNLLGFACLWEGRVGAAIEEFRHVVALDPKAVAARLNLADALLRGDRFDLAAAELHELARVHPELPYPLRRLAQLYVSRGRHADAAGVLRAIIEIVPDDVQAHVDLARALVRAGRSSEVAPILAAVRRLAPGETAPLVLQAELLRAAGDWGGVQAPLEEAAALDGGGEGALQLGLFHIHERHYKAARQVFAQALASPQPSGSVLAGGILAEQACGHGTEVLKLCRRAREEGPSRWAGELLAGFWLSKGDATGLRAAEQSLADSGGAPAVSWRGLLDLLRDRDAARAELALAIGRARLYGRSGWHAEAVGAAEAARRLAPQDLSVGILLAECYAAAQRPDDELKMRERLARDHPDARQATHQLARAYRARGQHARAQEVCRDLLKRYFDDIRAHLTIAEVACEQGDYATVLTHARAAAARHPHDPRPYALLVDAMLAVDRMLEAADVIRGRSAADPGYTPNSCERAILAVADGDTGLAATLCRRALRRTAADPRLRFFAGVLSERRGDLEEAFTHYLAVHWLRGTHLAPHLRLARVAAQLGRGEVVVDAYRSAVAAAPQRFSLHRRLADALARMGRGREAIEHLSALGVNDAAARHDVQARIAEEHLVLGEAQQALGMARKVLDENASHARARHAAVEACRRLDDVATALAVCQRAYHGAADPEIAADVGLLLILSGEYGEAAGQLAFAAARARERGAVFELEKLLAPARLASGKAELAHNAALRALSVRPRGERSSVSLLAVLALTRAQAAARHEVQRFRLADPAIVQWTVAAAQRVRENAELALLVLAGSVAAEYGWHGRAAHLFATALEHAPDEPLVLHGATRGRLETGRLADALASALRLAKRCPEWAEAHLLVGGVLERQNKKKAALDAYLRALPLLTQQQQRARFIISQRLAAAGRAEEAIEAMRTIVDSNWWPAPNDIRTHNNLAWLYALHKPGQLEEAERLAAVAVAEAPHAASYRDTLAWIHFLRGRHDAARREVLAALDLEPTEAVYLYHLGMIDYGLGHRRRARRALELALAREPGLSDAATAQATLKLIEAQEVPTAGSPKTPKAK